MDYAQAKAMSSMVGLLIFVGFFVAVLVWVFLRPGAKEQYKRDAQIPLREDD